MYIVTITDDKVAAFEATADDAKNFTENPELFDENMSGWVIQEQADLASKMSKPQMVQVYNALSGSTLVKFPTKDRGAERTMPYVERFAKPFEELASLTGGVKVDIAPEPKRRRDRGVHNLPVQEPIRQCRAGTKQQFMIEALANGATMAQLLEATSAKNGGKSWRETSVRSGFYDDVNKKGYGVRTETVTPGEPASYVYHLVYPEGMTEPLAPKKAGNSS